MRYRNALHKGSLEMARMLERYVEILYREVLRDREDLVCTLFVSGQRRLRTERSLDALREILNTPQDRFTI